MTGRDLMLFGGVSLVGVGIVLILVAVAAPRLFTLVWRWGGVTVVFPLGLCIILSVVLTVILNLVARSPR